MTTNRTEDNNADIFLLSAGPIVTSEGLMAGIDINRFVKRHIIDTQRTKPTTLIIDTTTALYKNLRLNPEVQGLVEQGQLSIIIFESHQKFGLIHSDQAQYGRMMGFYAKASFTEAVIAESIENSREDFYRHVDIRIGAFISTRCGEILEDIKQQHFTNGTILRNILAQTALVANDIITHEDMLHNLEELYFLNTKSKRLENLAFGVIDKRSSFGHFMPTVAGVILQRRFSPDASDALDCLVQAAHIYIGLHHSPEELLNMVVKNARNKEKLNTTEQIMVTGILNIIISNIEKIAYKPNIAVSFAAMSNALERCSSLKNRQYFITITRDLTRVRDEIIKQYKPINNHDFIATIRVLYDSGINVNDSELNVISKNKALIKYIRSKKECLSEPQFRALFALSSIFDENEPIFKLLNNKNFCSSILKVYNANQDILSELNQSTKKYEDAKKHSPVYLKDCFKAMYLFYNNKEPNQLDRSTLLHSLDNARKNYGDTVLSKDRSFASRAARLILKSVVNFSAALTLGIAHYIHYKQTGSVMFFSGTNSQNKLDRYHQALSNNIGQDTAGSVNEEEDTPSRENAR